MPLCVIQDATLRNCSENMPRETNRLEQSSVDPLLDPAEFFQGVVDQAQLGGMVFLKWPRPSNCLERIVIQLPPDRESNQRFS